MHNIHQYEGKTIREIQHRQGGEQIIIHFTDESFLIITACATARPVGSLAQKLDFTGHNSEQV